MAERDEWVPSFYDGYETRWSDEDQCYIARCSPEYGLLAFVKTHGDTREEAVQKLVEILPDVACMNHSTHDAWVQRAHKAEAEIERLRASTPEGSETETEHSPGYVIMAHYRRADGEWWWEPKAWKRYRDDADRFAGALKAYRTHTGAEVTHHVFPLSPPSHDVEALREALDWLENTVTKVRSDESAEAFGKAEGILFAVAYIRRSTHVGDEG